MNLEASANDRLHNCGISEQRCEACLHRGEGGGQNVLVTIAGWWLTLPNASYLGIVKQYFRFRISLTLNSKCKLWILSGTLSDEWGIKTLKLRRSQHQFSLLSNKFLTNLPLRIRSAIKLYLQVGIFLSSTSQTDPMLACFCSVTDHRWRQNVVRTRSWHRKPSRVSHWSACQILTCSMIFYWTDARQHTDLLVSNDKRAKCGWWWIQLASVHS